MVVLVCQEGASASVSVVLSPFVVVLISQYVRAELRVLLNEFPLI